MYHSKLNFASIWFEREKKLNNSIETSENGWYKATREIFVLRKNNDDVHLNYDSNSAVMFI